MQDQPRERPQPPIPKKLPTKLVHLGVERMDEYAWMKERDHPDVLEHLRLENEYTKKSLEPVQDLEESLFKEIVGRIKKRDESVPYRDRGAYFYTRFTEEAEYLIYCRKRGSLDSKEEILIDTNLRAKGHEYYSCGSVSVNASGKILAFAEDTQGRRIYTIFFKDLETQEILEKKIPEVTGNLVWSEQEDSLFYTKQDLETLRWNQVFRFSLNTGESELVFEEKDDRFYLSLSKTLTDRFILIETESKVTTETWLIPADQPEHPPQIFLPRIEGHEYAIEDGIDSFFVLSNLEAKNFRVMKTNLGEQKLENWQEVVPHRDEVYLEDIEVYKDFIFLQERERGLSQLRLISRTSGEDRYLEFPDAAYLAESDINSEYETRKFRYSYESMTRPESVFEYDWDSQQSNLLKQDEVLGGYEPEDYVSERIEIHARDGVQVPISLVRRRSTKPSKATPLLILGYGSYGLSEEPDFSLSRLSLLDRGFIVAVAHIRGGSEMGRHWYDDGKFLKKWNTFFDFIDCTEALLSRGYSSTEHCYAMGASAGGLLMGAAMNTRPDLYHGVIAGVPFVDVINTMLDKSLPLTTNEYEEWGNPDDEKYFRYMLSYSPYDNVKPQAYPHLLVTSGYHDSQVQYWEPTKWVARLRDVKTNDSLCLLYTDLSVGHAGPSGRFEGYRLIAKEFAFLLLLEGPEL